MFVLSLSFTEVVGVTLTEKPNYEGEAICIRRIVIV